MTQQATFPGHPWITPDWPAPERVRACATSREGGVSSGAFASLNLSDYVGDSDPAVGENRSRVRDKLALPAPPLWLHQVHGTGILAAHQLPENSNPLEYDGSYTFSPGIVCAVQTADCLPVLLCDRRGHRVAALHAGWRGLAAGILEAGVQAMVTDPDYLLAWLGPAIGPDAFEVGADVYHAFVDADAETEKAFRRQSADKWLADIYQLARRRLALAGVNAVYGGGFCTYNEATRFFSYRRDHTTGRMATLIWIQD